MKQKQDRPVSLTFVNHNYTFGTFYNNYKQQCLAIAEKTHIQELDQIRKIISTFIYDNDWTIRDKAQRNYYRERLSKINLRFREDHEARKILTKDFQIVKHRLAHHYKYYEYFLAYLHLLGDFAKELTATFMPHTNIQKKLLKYSNNQYFFDKFMEHKKIVLDSLSSFNLFEFSKTYNNLITFYYAYSLYINNQDRLQIEQLFSLILSIFLNQSNLSLLDNDSLNPNQLTIARDTEALLHNGLLFVNSKMNSSFSDYDVLPKLQSKVYVDKTLI